MSWRFSFRVPAPVELIEVSICTGPAGWWLFGLIFDRNLYRLPQVTLALGPVAVVVAFGVPF